jgi:hypothetical protein
MKKFLAFALLALAGMAAQATTYYFSDCQAGFDVGCKPGDDDVKNPGTSPSTPKKGLPSRALVDSLVAGDQVLLARNGAWTSAVTAFWTGNNKGKAANPIVIGDYTPAGYTGSAKPLITLTAPDAGCLTIMSGSSSLVHKEGFVFKNIKCVGTGIAGVSNASAIFLYTDLSDVLLENLDISGFGIGVYPASAPGADVSRVTLRNSFIHDNGNQGILGGGPYLLLEGNTFDNNGYYFTPLFLRHNVYLGNAPFMVVRGNTLTRSAVCNAKTDKACGTLNECQGVGLVVHGVTTDLVIENNVIDESAGATEGCYGIQVSPDGSRDKSDSFAGTIIRGNRLVNVGGNAIQVGSCPSCQVEDNVIVWNKAPKFTTFGVAASDVRPTGEDAVNANVLVRNNSIYLSGPNAYQRGIVVWQGGTGHKVVNNLVFFAADTDARAACFDTTGQAAASFDAFDYNICYSDRPDHLVAYSQAYPTLAKAQENNVDVHGKNANPLIATPTAANGYSMALASSGSPAHNAGHPALSKRLGYRGAFSPNASSFIGAYPLNPSMTALSSPRPYPR